MDKKILVIGAKGMLGSDLCNLLEKKSTSDNLEIIGWGINQFDITNKQENAKIINCKPDIIINCAAYTNVDLAETEKDKCYSINVAGVENLCIAAKQTNSLLVHISTDYVFDGKKMGYVESEKTNPLNWYGKTKAEGEEIIKSMLDDYYILRTSWLFSNHGKNFVNTITKIANEKKEIKVVNDQIGCPTYTMDLAEKINEFIATNPQHGIYHTTNSGFCSWYDFAKKIVEKQNIDCKVIPCTTEEYPRPAKRPKHSVLLNTKHSMMRNWKYALDAYLKE